MRVMQILLPLLLPLLLCFVVFPRIHGDLLHSWSFEGGFTDTITQNSPATPSYSPLQSATSSDPVPCNWYVQAGPSSTVTFPNIPYFAGDFLVSLWINIQHPSAFLTPIITQRQGCGPNYWLLMHSSKDNSLILELSDGTTTFSLSGPEPAGYWEHISFGRNGTEYLLYLGGRKIASEHKPAFNLDPQSNITIGTYQCADGQYVNAAMYYDELQIFDSFEDPFQIYHSPCIQHAPLAIYEPVSDDHSSITVRAYSFYFKFTNSSLYIINVDSAQLYPGPSLNISRPPANESLRFQIVTSWAYNQNILTSSSVAVLLPVGKLRHMWLFDGNDVDLVNNTGTFNIGAPFPTIQHAICGQALVVTNGAPRIAHSLSDISYVNDFTISFWMKLRGDVNVSIYSLLSQRSGCYLGDFWDLRYYPQQYITFELYSSEAINSRVDVRFYTDSIPFMDNWHHIVITRHGYEVAMHVNGTLSDVHTVYMNLNIQDPFGIVNSGCINVDGTIAPPSFAIDELQIYDRFVDPSELYLHPCVQYVPAPNITFDDGQHVNLTIEASFYDQFILPSVCTIYQQINGDSPTMRPCTNTLTVDVSLTANITWWVSRTYSSGVYNSTFLVRQARFPNGSTTTGNSATPLRFPSILFTVIMLLLFVV